MPDSKHGENAPMNAHVYPVPAPTKPSRPIMRPSDIRRAVSEWAAQGCTIEISPDGTIRVAPVGAPPTDPFDLVDMTR
jgi:hypothetical protein